MEMILVLQYYTNTNR